MSGGDPHIQPQPGVIRDTARSGFGETGERLDAALIRLDMARSRGQAKELVSMGVVTVGNRTARRAGARLKGGERVVVCAGTDTMLNQVGRGAWKLEAAFTAWEEMGFTVSGARCLDAGASTGGFTQVLLAHGADHVVALDVGHGQLAPAIAADPRVTDRSGTNLRAADPGVLGAPFDVVVADLSFISLTMVMFTIASLLRPQGQAVLLVKPQFELGRQRLTRSGVVRRAGDRLDAVLGVLTAAREAGLFARDIVHSPVPGARGNREYLLWVWSGSAALAERAQDEQARWDLVREKAARVVGEED